MIRKMLALASVLLVSLAASGARADAIGLQFSGFGTLGMVTTDASDLRFDRLGYDRPGPEDPDFSADSVIGIQANLVFTPQSSAVIQFISRENPNGNYDPHPSLAFVSQRLSQETTVRVGRLRIPFFMLSDSLNVNFAHPWIRPPNEVYTLNPFSDLDGIDLLFRTRFGEADLEIQPYFGRSYIPIYARGNAHLTRLAGINFTLTTEHLTLFLGHGESPLKLHWGDDDFTTLTSIMPAEVNQELSGNNGYAAFSAAGFQWDDGQWVLIGEFAKRVNRRYANSAHGWYLTAARRFGNLMPYLTFARQRQDRAVTSASFAGPIASIQAAALEGFLVSRNGAQDTVTVGTRWDFSRNAALKVELSRVRTTNDSWGNSLFPRGEPSLAKVQDRSINVLGVAIDVTF